MKGQRSGFSQRHGAGIAAIMFMAASLVAGCAGTSSGAPDQAAADDPMAMCRAAIADVGRFCAGEEADAGQCTNAKARSAEFCLED